MFKEKDKYKRAVVVLTKITKNEPKYFMTTPTPSESDFIDENVPNHLFVRVALGVSDIGKLVTKVMADFCPNAGIYVPKLNKDKDYPNTEFEIGGIAYTVVPALIGLRQFQFHNPDLLVVEGPVSHQDYCSTLLEKNTKHSKCLCDKLEQLRTYMLCNREKWSPPKPNQYLL